MGILVTIFGPMYVKFENRESGDGLLFDGGKWAIGGIIIIVLGIELERMKSWKFWKS